MTIFKRSRFVFVGVADEIALFHPVVEDLVPFDSRWKSCSSSPSQTGLLQFINHLGRLQLFHTSLPGFIATDFEIPLHLPRSTLRLLDKAWFCSRRHIWGHLCS